MAIKKIKVTKKKVDLVEKAPGVYEQAKAWFEAHPYHVFGTVAALLLVFAIYWAATAYIASTERRASEAYTSLMGQWPKEGEIGTEEAQKIIPELQKLIEERKGSRAAMDARLDLARAYYQVKQYEDALKWAKGVLEEARPDSPIASLARYQVALTSQAMGQTDEAIRQWEALKAGGMPNLGREVSSNLARLYAAKGDHARAVELYEAALKAEGSYPQTQVLQNELAEAKLKK